MRPTLDGDKMHIILILEDLTMIYAEVKFGNDKAEGTTFYSTVAGKHSFWLGGNKNKHHGVDMFDAYTVGSA